MTIIVALCIAASVGFLTYGVFALIEERRRRRSVSDRVQGLEASVGRLGRMHSQGTVGFLSGFFMNTVLRFGESLKPKKAEDVSKLKLSMIHAGFRQQRALDVFWGFKIGLTLLGAAVGAFLAFVAPIRVPGQFTMILFLGPTALFFYLPGFFLNRRIEKRKKAIQRGLPDALDLLVVCVEAGMGLDAAMTRVSEEMTRKEPVLAAELKLLTLELRAGKSRREALKNLAMRIDLEDVSSLVALLIQADIFGTSIAQTLRVYAEAMRTKRFQLAEEMAAKLPVKLLFPLVFFIFPTLLIIILGPAGIRLMQMFATTNK